MNPHGKLQKYIKILNRDEARAILLERLGMTKVRSNYQKQVQVHLMSKM